MSKQVLDIEQVKHLQELGLDTSNGSACWYRVVGAYGINVSNVWGLTFNLCIEKADGMYTQVVKTFTLQDILDILPKSTEYGQLQIHLVEYPNGMYGNTIQYESVNESSVVFFCNELIDSAYEMLCWCIENGYVKTNKEE